MKKFIRNVCAAYLLCLMAAVFIAPFPIGIWVAMDGEPFIGAIFIFLGTLLVAWAGFSLCVD